MQQSFAGLGCFHRLHAVANEMRPRYLKKKKKTAFFAERVKQQWKRSTSDAEAPRETAGRLCPAHLEGFSSTVRGAECPPDSRCFLHALLIASFPVSAT